MYPIKNLVTPDITRLFKKHTLEELVSIAIIYLKNNLKMDPPLEDSIRYPLAIEMLQEVYQTCCKSGTSKRDLCYRVAAELHDIYSGIVKSSEGKPIIEPNRKLAFEYLQAARDSNHPNILFNLAIEYELGGVVEKDINKALQLYEQAAKNGNIKAYYHAALILFRNEEVNGSQMEEMNKAHNYLLMAARQNYPEALYTLAYHYIYRKNIPQIKKLTPNLSLGIGLRYLQKAVSNNHKHAISLLNRLTKADTSQAPTPIHCNREEGDGPTEKTQDIISIHVRYSATYNRSLHRLFYEKPLTLEQCILKQQEMQQNIPKCSYSSSRKL
jgi:TPR repeat protein